MQPSEDEHVLCFWKVTRAKLLTSFPGNYYDLLKSHAFPLIFIIIKFSFKIQLSLCIFLCNPFSSLNLSAQMASSSTHSGNTQSEQYIIPERTTLIPVDSLEVISELMVDLIT